MRPFGTRCAGYRLAFIWEGNGMMNQRVAAIRGSAGGRPDEPTSVAPASGGGDRL
jgi:hypothetical protein